MRDESNDFIIHVDELRFVQFPTRELVVYGWCGTPDYQLIRDLRVEWEGQSAPCLTGLERLDVAHYLTRPSMSHAGFAARIPVRTPRTFLRFVTRDSGTPVTAFTALGPSEEAVPGEQGPKNLYPAWLSGSEKALFWPPEEVAARIEQLAWKPLLTILLPVFDTEPYHLYRCVESVLSQKYPYWQLAIADDASKKAATLAGLREIGGLDARITVMRAARNGGISAASNLALERAEGEFIIPLDHDDELHPYALLEVARVLNADPEADLVYSDEDKIDQTGRRSHPAFKPDFDPEMLLSFNYVGHLAAMRTSLVREAGGYRPECDGAQDWDLLLRVTERSSRERIHHIPKPLYHWRLHDQSTSMSLDAKPYAQIAWRKVLEGALARRGADATVGKGLFLGSMRVRWNARERCNGTLRAAVVVRIDDGFQQQRAVSRTRGPEAVKFYELAHGLMRPLEGNLEDNEDARALTTWSDIAAPVVIFLNTPIDAVNHHFLEELASQCERPDCGMVTGVLADRDSRMISGGLEVRGDRTVIDPARGLGISSLGYMGRFKVVRAVPCIAPHYFAVRRDLLAELGGIARIPADSLDRLTGELTALCHRKGLKILFTPYAIATSRRPIETAGVFPSDVDAPARLRLNRNLDSLPDAVEALQTGL